MKFYSPGGQGQLLCPTREGSSCTGRAESRCRRAGLAARTTWGMAHRAGVAGSQDPRGARIIWFEITARCMGRHLLKGIRTAAGHSSSTKTLSEVLPEDQHCPL